MTDRLARATAPLLILVFLFILVRGASAQSGTTQTPASPAVVPEPSAQAAPDAPSTPSPKPQAPAPKPQAAVAPGVDVLPSEPQHGWVVVRDHVQQVTHLIHLPPRNWTEGGLEPGEARMVTAAPQTVDRLGTYSPTLGVDSVFLVLHDEPGGERGSRVRKVLGISASRINSSVWDYPPGRLEVLPALPGMHELCGVAGATPGPVALLRTRPARMKQDQSPADSWSLVLLQRNQWLRVALPWDPEATVEAGAEKPAPWDLGAPAWIVNWSDPADSFAVLIAPIASASDQRSAPASLWIATLGKDAGGAVDPGAVDPGAVDSGVKRPARWVRRDVPWPRSFALSRLGEHAVAMPDQVLTAHEPGGGFGTADHLLAIASEPGRVSITELRASGPVPVVVLDGVPRDASVAAVARSPDSASLAFVWLEEQTADASGSTPSVPNSSAPVRPSARASLFPRLVMREVSLLGDTVYSGPLRTGQQRFSKEAEFLAALLLMVMVAIVLFVIRPDVPTRVRLPDRVVVASPVRRLFAAAVDYAPAALIAGWLLDVRAADALLPIPFLSDSYDPWLVLLSLGIAFVHTTIFEALFGRSLGGAASGIWVLSVTRAPARVSTSDGGGEASKSDSDESAADEPARAELPPGLLACIIRNFVRWLMPVLSVLVLLDPMGRHPGDLSARTIVVQDEPPAEDDAD